MVKGRAFRGRGEAVIGGGAWAGLRGEGLWGKSAGAELMGRSTWGGAHGLGWAGSH